MPKETQGTQLSHSERKKYCVTLPEEWKVFFSTRAKGNKKGAKDYIFKHPTFGIRKSLKQAMVAELGNKAFGTGDRKRAQNKITDLTEQIRQAGVREAQYVSEIEALRGECAICFEFFGTGVRYRTVLGQCGHQLCKTCGVKLWEDKSDCPFCNVPLTAEPIRIYP